MKRFVCLMCVLTGFLTLSGSCIAAPLEAYAKLPQYEDVSISPDGARLAFITTVGDERQAVIQSLSGQEEGVRVSVGNQKLRGLEWIGPDHLAIISSQSTNFFTGSQTEMRSFSFYDLAKKKIIYLSDFQKPLGPALLTARDAVLPATDAGVVLGGWSYGSTSVFWADLAHKTLTVLDASNGQRSVATGWLTDPAGNLLARTTYDEIKKRWSLSLLRNREWIEVQSELTSLDDPRAVGIGPEPGVVTYNRVENGELVPRRISLSDGKWGEALPEKLRGERYIKDKKSGYVIGALKFQARRHYVFFDVERQKKWDKLIQNFPGVEVELKSWSDDWQKLVVQVFSVQSGVGYALFDAEENKISYLGNLYSNIEPADMMSVKAISYNAGDGLQINGYLTFPRNRPTKNMPVIVVPHGGPSARDTFDFEWIAQALAARGYLVLQPNFRGSWGLGEKFKQAGYGEWGGKMQTDLSDGVKALVKLGIADPARVCIFGWSYGGYAALAAAMMESDLYRCAASMAGISDLKKSFYEDTPQSQIQDRRSLRNDLRYVGAKDLNDKILAERSPALHADKVGIPVLLIHGDNDSVVPFEQSKIMANALKKANKPYEFVKLKSEDHWLSKADTRLQMLQAVVKFLETNNPP